MKPGSILAGALSVAMFFAVITLMALEGSEVVVLRTRDAQGVARATRIWIAEHDGSSWIEAANPQRDFYRDILANPTVDLDRNGTSKRYRAVPLEQPRGHELIRGLLSEKYGVADWWIGLIADTS